MNTPIIQYLEKTVIYYMSNRKPFTSLDIANTAKEAGYQVRNRDVANWLRHSVIPLAYKNSYLYNQSLIRVDSKAAGMTLAYLYHHYEQDVDEYQDRDQNPKPFKTKSETIVNKKMDNNSPVIFFDTRAKARDFARNNQYYKFKDTGIPNKRWSCYLIK